MNKKLLTIAIPTFNRANMLKECLQNIYNNWDHRIEIIVSDNKSSDTTEEVVKFFVQKYNINLSYYKNDENIGFDRNILNLVDKTSSKYILFHADDDLFSSNAITYICDILEQKEPFSIYLKYITLTNRNRKIQWFRDMPDMYIGNKNVILTTLGSHILFISSLLCKTESLKQAFTTFKLDQYIGKNQMQLFLYMSSLSFMKNSDITIIPQQICIEQHIDPNPSWVGFYMFGTDVIKSFKMLERFGYDIATLKKIENQFIKQFVTKNYIAQVGKNIISKIDIISFLKEIQMENKSNIIYWIYFYPITLIPFSFIRFLYKIKKRYFK